MNMIDLFDFEKIGDFDKHISLSIPDYSGLCDIFSAIILENVSPYGHYIDLGCSTGKFISSIPKLKNTTYTGVDAVDIREYKDFEFIQNNAIDYIKSISSADVISVMFLLQFLGKHKRAELIKELVRLNNNGALVLISEKVYFDNSSLNQVLYREHQKQKRKGFLDKDILDKDYRLIGSMFCLSESGIDIELSDFNNYSSVWQSYSFKGWAMFPR